MPPARSPLSRTVRSPEKISSPALPARSDFPFTTLSPRKEWESSSRNAAATRLSSTAGQRMVGMLRAPRSAVALRAADPAMLARSRPA